MGDRGISGFVAGGRVSSRVSLVVPDHGYMAGRRWAWGVAAGVLWDVSGGV